MALHSKTRQLARSAESELGVLTSQCLNRRIPNKQILVDEIAAWEHDRNANHTKADWQFTTKNARILPRPATTALKALPPTSTQDRPSRGSRTGAPRRATTPGWTSTTRWDLARTFRFRPPTSMTASPRSRMGR